MLAQNCGHLLIALLLITDEVQKPAIPFGGTDFKQYYATSRLILEGHNPYDHEKVGAIQRKLGHSGSPQVPYGPPTSLLPFIPLGWLDFSTAIEIHLILNLCLLFISCLLWDRLFLTNIYPVGIAVMAIWVPNWTLLGLGQVSAWLLFGYALWYWSMKKQHPMLAGIALILTIIKPHLGFGLVVYALVLGYRQKQWTMLISFFATLTLVILATFLIRPTIWMEYIHSLQQSNPRQWLNATLDGGGRSVFGDNFSYLSWVWCSAVLGLIVWLAWTRSMQDPLGVLVMSLWLAACPYAFSYDFSLMLPAIVMTVGYTLKRSHPLALLALSGWFFLSITAYVCKASWREHDYFFFPICGLIITVMITGLGKYSETTTS